MITVTYCHTSHPPVPIGTGDREGQRAVVLASNAWTLALDSLCPCKTAFVNAAQVPLHRVFFEQMESTVFLKRSG